MNIALNLSVLFLVVLCLFIVARTLVIYSYVPIPGTNPTYEFPNSFALFCTNVSRSLYLINPSIILCNNGLMDINLIFSRVIVSFSFFTMGTILD